MHKDETRSRCVWRKNTAHTAGGGTFPFQHSYAFQHCQLYHLFNDFILKGNVQSLPKILKIHFIHSWIFYLQVIFLLNFNANWRPLVFFLFYSIVFPAVRMSLALFSFMKIKYCVTDGCAGVVRRMCSTPQVIRKPKASLFFAHVWGRQCIRQLPYVLPSTRNICSFAVSEENGRLLLTLVQKWLFPCCWHITTIFSTSRFHPSFRFLCPKTE